MNDFDYDVMQKKITARGAYHVKRGSRSKKCTLPSDNLSPAQLKKRNGVLMQYNLNNPMQWETFKAMPKDIQREYIQSLISKYSVSMKRLSEMFGVHVTSLSRYFKAFPEIKFYQGKKMSKEEMAAFESFLNPTSEGVSAESGSQTKDGDVRFKYFF